MEGIGEEDGEGITKVHLRVGGEIEKASSREITPSIVKIKSLRGKVIPSESTPPAVIQ